MSQPSSDMAMVLSSLERLLESDPNEGGQGLAEVPKTLTEFIEQNQLEVCEKAAKLLGDALGKQSMIAFPKILAIFNKW
jgi:hypothetical protein